LFGVPIAGVVDRRALRSGTTIPKGCCPHVSGRKCTCPDAAVQMRDSIFGKPVEFQPQSEVKEVKVEDDIEAFQRMKAEFQDAEPLEDLSKKIITCSYCKGPVPSKDVGICDTCLLEYLRLRLDNVTIHPQSGRVQSTDKKIERESFMHEPNKVGKFLKSVVKSTKNRVMATFEGWWEYVKVYLDIAKEYAAAKVSQVIDAGIWKSFKGFWKQANKAILGITVTTLAGLAWYYRAKIGFFMDSVLTVFCDALDAFGGLFSGLGEWLKAMFDFTQSESVSVDATATEGNSKVAVEAQAGICAVAATVGAVCGFMAEKKKTEEKTFSITFENVRNIAKTVIPLVAAAKIASEGMSKVFDWMPNVIKETLYVLFGITGSNVSPGTARFDNQS